MNVSTLPTCRHRGEQIAAGRWTCNSRKLVVPARVVTGEFCATQCPYVDHSDSVIEVLGKRNANGTIHSRMTIDEFRAKIEKPNADFPKGWQRWQIAQLTHRRMLEDAVANASDYPGGYTGRGIVIAAGGPVYFACAYVCVSVLRELGCELPVEFWHLGPGEIDAHMAELVAPLGVRCRDARTIEPQPRLLNGWELKPFSIVHSAFEEVLFLDADNVPVRDPTYLFDDRRYRQSGAIFWPDLPAAINPPGRLHDLTWDVAAIQWRERLPFETGQILIDKSKCWRELHVTMHLNEHSDFWYRYVYGDKDTFKLAWHKVERDYSMPKRESDWIWPAILQYDLDDNLVFTHACQGKSRLVNGHRLAALPQCDLAVKAAGELRRTWSNPKVIRGIEKIDTTTLEGAEPFFNAALFSRPQGLFLAYRSREKSSRLGIACLNDRTYQPIFAKLLNLDHPLCLGGQEDPRVFYHRGKTFLQFSGVRGQGTQIRVNVLLAELSENFNVRSIHAPFYPGNQSVEKNWQFFSWNDKLFAVYTVSPHVVIAFDEKFQGKQKWETDCDFHWTGGLLRGGASPQRLGDEFFCFFHGVRRVNGQDVYTAGAYTFAARPPFPLRRITRNPILEPAATSRPRGNKLVVYPCGAVFRNDRWLISYGVNDCRIEVAEVDHHALVRELEDVTQ